MREYGYLRKDDDGHWYLVPEGVVKNFDNIRDQIDAEKDEEKQWDLEDLFNETFGNYRLDGYVGNLKIEMNF